MPTILDRDQYLEKMLSLPRPGGEEVLAFYEHRIGAICKDPALMLLPLDDHLVHRGDGVFETLKYLDGLIYQLDPHIERMKRSSSAIFLEPPCSWEEIRQLIIDVAKAGGKDKGLIRVLLGRGPGGFGIDPYECPTPSLYIAAYNLHVKPEEVFERGVTAFRSSIPAKQSYIAKIKSIDYLPNMLMKREAIEKKQDFGLCFNDFDFLAEGSTENVCLVDKNSIIVVPEFTNALAGTTLLRALELVKDEYTIQFKSVSEGEILEAKEFMAIGTTIDCLSIVRFNNKPISDVRPGPISKQLRRLLKEDHKANGTPIR